MPIGPTTYFRKDRVFVDREPCVQAFRENILKSEAQKYNVLFYYGIAGIGKSKLQKKLQRILDEEYPEILWVSINLNTRTYREVGTFLITLRNKFQEKCKAKFYLFNIVHAIYWKKLHPEIPLQKENYPLIKEGGFFNQIINILDEFGSIHAGMIWDIINNSPDYIRRLFKEQSVDVYKLLSMEAHELEELLPGFFAADFTSYLGGDSRVYIFVDTYEALWEGLRDKNRFHEIDAWIRDNLIQNLFGVSWVISGREKLLWEFECDPDWKMYLEQHCVDEIPGNCCIEFLEDCGIESKDIQDLIIKSSDGIPYYLNLSVDIFEKISKKRKPIPEDFGMTHLEITDTTVEHLGYNEIQALEVLSVPNFWDKNLFEILMEKFGSGLQIDSFSELTGFSFIKKDADIKWSIHQLMRKSLQEHQDPIDRKNVHKFLFEHYNNKLKEIEIKSITSENEKDLIESFYHANKVYETKDLLDWFIDVSDPFDTAAFWQLIAPMYEEMLQIFEVKLGSRNPEVATVLNNLAELYRHMGDYEKALPIFQRALCIRESVLDRNHPDIATTLNNLGLLYDEIGGYEKALLLYQKALAIRENTLGPKNPKVASTLNNLAGLFEEMGNYEKALILYQRALEIWEKMEGCEHPDVAVVVSNLAKLYYYLGDYEKALSFYQRALDIFENVRSPQHPDVSTTLTNLAVLYFQMEDYEKALSLYQRALDDREKRLGAKHPAVANSLNNLASLYHQMGDYKKALSFYQRALDILENVVGPEHPDVAATFNNLAALYYQMGDYEKALLLYQRALEIYENTLGSHHPEVAKTLNNLAILYSKTRSYEKALLLFQRVLNIRKNALGPNHPDVVATLNDLAVLYKSMGDYKKATEIYKRLE